MEFEMSLVRVIKGGKVWDEEEGFSSPSQLFRFAEKGDLMLYSTDPLLYYLFADSPLVMGVKYLRRRFPSVSVGVWVRESGGEWVEFKELLLDVLLNFAAMGVSLIMVPLRAVPVVQRAVEVMFEKGVETPRFAFFYPPRREGYDPRFLHPSLLSVPYFHVFVSPSQLRGEVVGWAPFGAFLGREDSAALPLRILRPLRGFEDVAS
jgi:hypothetical protein